MLALAFIASTLTLANVQGTTVAAKPAAAQPVAAASTEMWADPTNAALIYYKQWIGRSKEDRDKIREVWPAAMDKVPTEEVVKLLKSRQDEIGAYIRAGKAPECDFGIEWSNGFMAIMPHLSECRDVARMLALDAQRLASEGKPDDAAERVAAIYQLAGHVAKDRILISSLVSIAISAVGDKAAVYVVTTTRPTVASRDMMLAAAKQLRAGDFGVMSAIRSEREIASQRLTREYRDVDAGKKLMNDIGGAMLDSKGPEAAKQMETQQAIAAMDGVSLAADLQKMDGYYTELSAAWNVPDAIDKIKTLEARLSAGEFGTVAKVIGPAFNKVRVSETKGQAGLDATIAKLGQY
ncbi:MAG: hypothetical protein ACREJO_07985 [Phycisphaerales bacterium]